jgi:hypothetical protein
MALQIPTIILPQSRLGTEIIADADVHYSLVIPTAYLKDKTVLVWAENLAGNPGPLLGWIELSYSGADLLLISPIGPWVPLGIPSVLPAGGPGNFPLAWSVQSKYVRVALQAPLWVNDQWECLVTFEGK